MSTEQLHKKESNSNIIRQQDYIRISIYAITAIVGSCATPMSGSATTSSTPQHRMDDEPPLLKRESFLTEVELCTAY